MLDKRLNLCMEMVTGNGIACDIGTDHAYLAVELINSGKCSNVIASDIGEGPLEAAAKTVEKYGLADKIQLILSDGLNDIPSANVTDIIIAGMGGETIVNILNNVEWIRNEINLVLQPMTKTDVLRKWLGENGFEVKCEKAAEIGDKIYTVMKAEFNGCFHKVTEADALRGKLDINDATAKRYIEKQAERLAKVGNSLELVGNFVESKHYYALSQRLITGTDGVMLNEIYDYFNLLYPFSAQESYDNSGLLVNSHGEKDIKKVLLALDITNNVCDEAKKISAELIISHHPVIFNPLKKIDCSSPVWRLIRNEISAISIHTNLDRSANGTNGVILKELKKHFKFSNEPMRINGDKNDFGDGWICNLEKKIDSALFAEELKKIFDCEVVRFSRNSISVKKFAFCSGSGGFLLNDAVSLGCDALITGDVKHDIWISAENSGLSIFDCGHFHTENIVLNELKKVINSEFPQLEVVIAKSSVDPVKYVK